MRFFPFVAPEFLGFRLISCNLQVWYVSQRSSCFGALRYGFICNYLGCSVNCESGGRDGVFFSLGAFLCFSDPTTSCKPKGWTILQRFLVVGKTQKLSPETLRFQFPAQFFSYTLPCWWETREKRLGFLCILFFRDQVGWLITLSLCTGYCACLLDINASCCSCNYSSWEKLSRSVRVMWGVEEAFLTVTWHQVDHNITNIF